MSVAAAGSAGSSGRAPAALVSAAGTAVPGERARLRRQRRQLVWELGIGACLVLITALFLVWVRLQVVRTGYQLSAARRLEQRLQQEQRELALELATLTSARRLDKLARERLGMRPPTRGEVVGPP